MIKLRALFNFLVQKWWITYGSSLALFFLWLVIALFGPPIPKPDAETIFYPRVSGRFDLLVLIAMFTIIIGSILYGLKKKSFVGPILLALTTLFCLIAILAVIGPQIGTIMTGFEPNPTLTHVDSVRTNGYIYNLAKHDATYDAIGNNYILYKCDSLGIMCQAIYRYKQKTLNDAYADIDNQPFISSDNANITVHIAGKVVYTLPASSDA